MPASQSKTPQDRTARRVYGRRHGRRLRDGRKRLLETLLPEISLPDLTDGPTLDLRDLQSTAVGTADQVWLEIGFGTGEHLAWQAAQNPAVLCLGAEVFINGVASLLKQIDEADLSNIRIHNDDAHLLLAALPEASISRVFVLFSDPWPKARHHKRRFIRPATMDRLATILRDGAEFRLASDHADYVTWLLAQTCRHPAFDWLVEGPADWRTRPTDWPPTRYEQKAVAAGRSCAYLRFRRKAR